MARHKLLWIPVGAQFCALGVQLWLPIPYGMYAQFVSVLAMLVVYGAFGTKRFQELRCRYKEIKRARAEQEIAFRSFVDAHVHPPNGR